MRAVNEPSISTLNLAILVLLSESIEAKLSLPSILEFLRNIERSLARANTLETQPVILTHIS